MPKLTGLATPSLSLFSPFDLQSSAGGGRNCALQWSSSSSSGCVRRRTPCRAHSLTQITTLRLSVLRHQSPSKPAWLVLVRKCDRPIFSKTKMQLSGCRKIVLTRVKLLVPPIFFFLQRCCCCRAQTRRSSVAASATPIDRSTTLHLPRCRL